MAWEFDNRTPVFLQITEHIKEDILLGVYPAGSQIPPVRALALQAGVNPNTMQRALSQLENDGILHTQATTGRFVTPTAPESLRAEATAELVARMRLLGITKEELLRALDKKA